MKKELEYPKQIHDLKLRKKKIVKWKSDEFKLEMLLKKDWINCGGS